MSSSKACLKCGQELSVAFEDMSDGTPIHCVVYECGNCGAKCCVYWDSGQGSA